jgi:hypothetical protein
MEINEVRRILKPQFGYLAKSDGELLYSHHFNVWSIGRKILEFVPSLDEKEKYLFEIACLIHDIGKMKRSIQEALKKGKELPEPHKITSEDEVKEYLNNSQINLPEEDLKFIVDVIRTHHGVSEKDLKEISTSGAQFFTLLLQTSDWLASMKYVSFGTLNKLQEIYTNIKFTAFQYSRPISPSAFLIVKLAIKKYEEFGWKVLYYPENGIVFVGSKNCKLPDKTFLVEAIYNEIIKKSLELQNPIPQRADREILSFPASNFLEEFLEIHKEKIIDALGNIDQKGFVFLRYYKDICKIKKIKIENEIVEIINSACGSSGSLKTKAKVKFKEKFRQEISNPKEVLIKLFDKIKLNDILSEGFLKELSFSSNNLKDLKPEELFQILKNLAKPEKQSKIKETLLTYLNSIILMEEEIGFKALANEIFEKYKLYKKTSDAEKGVCEICSCPVSFKMQPALNLSRTPQAFSQIKAKYAYRAICPLCIYDNFIFRKNISQNKIPVYIRITTKVPDLFINIDELQRFINKVRSALTNVRRIEKVMTDEKLKDIPFAEIIEIPIGDEKKETEIEPRIEANNLFFELEQVTQKNYSPKDMKIKYEPLYHVLKMLGFNVAIGTEEQEELFGEKIETNEENYYKSLATIIFAARIMKKEVKKYIYARELIEKGPSVAITTIGDSIEGRKISEDLIKCLIKGMIKSKIIIARR